ncbi:hypothetical protein ACFXKD_21445 [Nocardiopsis aegyptia]|uniref:hypothetical protein n=1 Tax=Nocardiopsis aegyptia TaxID=220378 RepID=UPI0036715311
MRTLPRDPDSSGAPGAGDGGESVELEEEYADVFNCGVLEVSCHITHWFHSLVLGILEPLFGWIAGRLFATPGPTDGVTGIWQGAVATANALYILFIIAAGFVVMTHHSLQAQYGAREILPRLAVGFVTSNVSLAVVGLAAEVSTEIAQAISSDGIDTQAASRHLAHSATPFLGEEATAVVLFLVLFVVLLVVWVIVEIVRVVIVILLMVGGPFLLMFHALPQTNALAQMWWRALAAVCLVPIAQAVAFVALMRLFFEGDAEVLFGAHQIIHGEADLFDLFLLLVLVYVQIRIPIWAFRAVRSPGAGRSPVAGLAKTLTWALVLSAATAATGGTAAAGATVGGVGGRNGALLRAGCRLASSTAATRPMLPRRVRTWRFSTQTASGAHRATTASMARPQPAASGTAGQGSPLSEHSDGLGASGRHSTPTRPAAWRTTGPGRHRRPGEALERSTPPSPNHAYPSPWRSAGREAWRRFGGHRGEVAQSSSSTHAGRHPRGAAPHHASTPPRRSPISPQRRAVAWPPRRHRTGTHRMPVTRRWPWHRPRR